MEYFGKDVIAVNAVKINYIKIVHKIDKKNFSNSILNLSIFFCLIFTIFFAVNLFL